MAIFKRSGLFQTITLDIHVSFPGVYISDCKGRMFCKSPVMYFLKILRWTECWKRITANIFGLQQKKTHLRISYVPQQNWLYQMSGKSHISNYVSSDQTLVTCDMNHEILVS